MKLKNIILSAMLFCAISLSYAQPNQYSPLGINVPAIADFSPALPFQDYFKSSRVWVSQSYHKDSTGWDVGPRPLDLDENGWVKSFINPDHYVTSVVSGDFPDRPTGTYHVFYEGEGTLRFWGDASFVSEPEPGHILIDVVSNGVAIFMNIEETDPNNDGNYIKNIQIIPEKFIDTYKTETWNPDYLKVLEKFRI